MTVAAQLDDLESTGEVPQLDERTGASLASIAAAGGLKALRHALRVREQRMAAETRHAIATSTSTVLLEQLRDRLVVAIEVAPTVGDVRALSARLVAVVIDLNRSGSEP